MYCVRQHKSHSQHCVLGQPSTLKAVIQQPLTGQETQKVKVNSDSNKALTNPNGFASYLLTKNKLQIFSYHSPPV